MMPRRRQYPLGKDISVVVRPLFIQAMFPQAGEDLYGDGPYLSSASIPNATLCEEVGEYRPYWSLCP